MKIPFFSKKTEKYSLNEDEIKSITSSEMGFEPAPEDDIQNNFPSQNFTPQNIEANPFENYSTQSPSNSLQQTNLSPEQFQARQMSNPSNFQSNQGFGNEGLNTNPRLETIELKLSLLEARVNNMDHKIDLILQIIKYEVSDETKRKMRLDDLNQRIR